MNSLLKTFLAVLGITMATCTNCPSATVEEAKKSEKALADFAVNFYKKVSAATQDKNAVMSPVSVALALALLESGANGQTRDKIKNVLVGQDSNVEVLATYRALQKQMQISDDKTKVSIANSLYPQKNFNLKPEYVSNIKDCYEGEVENVDFQGQLEQTRQKINNWVSEKTNKKIPELYKPGALTPDVVLVLANAIYFKGAWNSAFNEANTKPDKFYRFGREEQTVQFMKQTGSYRYVSENDLDVLEMAYTNQDLAMYILLPKAKDGLKALEEGLTGDKFKSTISRVQPNQVRLEFPKFYIRSPIDLKDILVSQGLDVIFSDSADFKRMSTADLKVSKAVHQAFIIVNENGTEAAAATGFSMVPRSGPPSNPIPVKVDHPFLYAIVHKPTGAIMFLGKVNFVEEKEKEN